MPLLSANLNIMEKACKKASKLLIRDFGEVEKNEQFEGKQIGSFRDKKIDDLFDGFDFD